MQVKYHDFVEVEYTGRLKENNVIFDTTDEKTATENNIHQQGMKYGPVIICVGESHVLLGLDKALVGKEEGRGYEIDIIPEDGFGKKSAKLIQLISTGKFLKEKIQPQPGLQVNVDGKYGIVKTVSGGRTVVDFNHPLAGKELIYSFKILKIVTDDNEKAQGLVELQFGKDNFELEMNDGELVLKLKIDIPPSFKEAFEKQLKELIPSIKKVTYKKEEIKKEKKEEEKLAEKKEIEKEGIEQEKKKE